jgi:type VI secretion system protein ImpJ
MLRKPHWTLGLELGPHHLQFQDQYHEDLVARRFAALFDYAWGIRDVAWDASAVASGRLTLKLLDAVLPDGTPIQFGAEDASPTLVVPDLGRKDSLVIYAGVAKPQTKTPSVGDGSANPPTRYVKETSLAPDYASGTDPIRIEWLRPNVRLLHEGDKLNDFAAVACARVIRAAAGGLAIDETFVPPILSIHASPVIKIELRKLFDALVGRKALLARATRQTTEGAQRWLLSLLGSFVPRVADMIEEPHASPLALYRLLAELHGAIAPFSPVAAPNVGSFDYNHLDKVFSGLFGDLAVTLDALGAQHHRLIPLQRYDQTTLFAELKEPAIFRNEFFLGVIGMDVGAIRAEVPRQFKIGAWADLAQIVRTATIGVPLHPEARAPAALPDVPGVVYFRLEKNAAFTPIFKSGQIGIYHTPGLGVTDIALYAVDPGAM